MRKRGALSKISLVRGEFSSHLLLKKKLNLDRKVLREKYNLMFRKQDMTVTSSTCGLCEIPAEEQHRKKEKTSRTTFQ